MKTAEPCPIGREITSESRCREVRKHAASLGLNPKKPLVVGSSKGVPYQCSTYDDALHWNTNSETNNARLTTGEFVMICETGKTLFLYFLCLTFKMYCKLFYKCVFL